MQLRNGRVVMELIMGVVSLTQEIACRGRPCAEISIIRHQTRIRGWQQVQASKDCCVSLAVGCLGTARGAVWSSVVCWEHGSRISPATSSIDGSPDSHSRPLERHPEGGSAALSVCRNRVRVASGERWCVRSLVHATAQQCSSCSMIRSDTPQALGCGASF